MNELPTQVTPEQMAALEAALNKAAESKAAATTSTNSEANFNGKWVDPRLLHLYQRAKLEHTAQGDKWVVELTEYFTATKPYGSSPASVNKNGEPKNLGEYITMVINNPEGWVLFNVLPNGAGMGVAVFKRVLRQALPDPEELTTQTEVPELEETEIEKMAEAALRWEAGNTDDNADLEADIRDLAASDAAVEGADYDPERQ